jgi:hypothetical protein
MFLAGVEMVGGAILAKAGWGGDLALGIVVQAQSALDGAQTIDRFVARHGDSPTERLPAGDLIHRGLFPNHEHHLLRDILGVVGIVEDFEGGGKNEGDMAAVKFLEAGPIAGPDSLDQLGIVGRLTRGLVGYEHAHGIRSYAPQLDMANKRESYIFLGATEYFLKKNLP